MDFKDIDGLAESLIAGFETLQTEYEKLQGRHHELEQTLSAARQQYNELAKLCSSGAVTTPPLSLSSSVTQQQNGTNKERPSSGIRAERSDGASEEAHTQIKEAADAVVALKQYLSRRARNADGVKIWSGRSADEVPPTLLPMPDTSHAQPLEQDFTIEGVPSKLGCPFASMATKNLSSHAASVLSRYNQGSAGASVSAASRINGKESFAKRHRHRPSFVDPIKAEIDHDQEPALSEDVMKEHLEKQDEGEVGVCPIRFLDQHSPEEVATYFEKHKHELPRSHEVCVKRYQSNEQQIRELDAKYGNLVTMIQGLGKKHKDMLPKEPEEGEENVDEDVRSNEKVRNWAHGIPTQPADGVDAEGDDDERQPHFERPLREIRVGESPSRPWGIHVPTKYLEGEESKPIGAMQPAHEAAKTMPETQQDTAPRCPFKFDKEAGARRTEAVTDAEKTSPPPKPSPESGHMVFTGPVFIGYSPENAAKFLQSAGYAMR